ncbi:MAG: hypothetical protein K2M46_10515 [Lachnospiraceae bacterium]|nr:hypothetical protein [Lachnospiraceae bacterium]
MKKAEFTHLYTYSYKPEEFPACVTPGEILNDLQRFFVKTLGYSADNGILYKNDIKSGFSVSVSSINLMSDYRRFFDLYVTVREDGKEVCTATNRITTGVLIRVNTDKGEYRAIRHTITIEYNKSENGVLWRFGGCDYLTCKAEKIIGGEERYYYAGIATGSSNLSVGSSNNGNLFEVLEGQLGNKRENCLTVKVSKGNMPENYIIMSPYIYYQELAKVKGLYVAAVHPKNTGGMEIKVNGKKYYMLKSCAENIENLVFEMGDDDGE